MKPQTYMNEAGRSAGPARGSFKLDLDRVLVLHDEIDLPFGDIRVRLGGGLAGHNGLKSLKRELGSPDFHRVRIGVGRPDSTDPDIVAAYVLGRWRQPRRQVDELISRAADEAERVVSAESHSVEVQREVHQRERAVGRARPLLERAVPVELQAVAVWIGEVDRTPTRRGLSRG